MTGRQLLSRLLWRTGTAAAARRILTRGGRFVVELHGVARRKHPEVHGGESLFTAADLDRTVDWIAERFRLLTPRQFLAGAEPGVLLSFDDGFANLFTNALPVLESASAPAVFFVTTQHVQEPRDWLAATRERARSSWGDEDRVPEPIARDLYDGLSREQLLACAEHPLVTIGSHTVHHPFLTRCDDATLEDELTISKRQLEQWCGQEIDLFAFPSGDYDSRVARAVRKAGYRAAFVEDAAPVGEPAFEIPRVGIYASGPAYLAAKLSGLHRRPISCGAPLLANDA